MAADAEWNQAHGLPPQEARRQAQRQFGNTLATLEAVRAIHARAWIETLAQDLRYALRSFRKAPAFSVVAAAAGAAWIPARRAALVDPVVALRQE